MKKSSKAGFILVLFLSLLVSSNIGPQNTANPTPGQSITLLADGRLFLVGGEAASGRRESTASIWDPRTGAVTPLSSGLQAARAYHSATMLPDGTVLIFGGIGSDGQVLSSPEVFDPSISSFILPASSINLSPRAHHSATLLTDGRVLIVGGVGSNGQILNAGEIFDPSTQSSVLVAQSSPRSGHTATLLADGLVLLSGGKDENGVILEDGELFDPVSQQFTPVSPSEIQKLKSEIQTPQLEASLPIDGAMDVPIDALISLRFSTPLNVVTVNTDAVTLSGPNAIEQIKVVPAEGGMLAFITPEQHLLPGSTYTVSINGAAEPTGAIVPFSTFSFSTEALAIGTPPPPVGDTPPGGSLPPSGGSDSDGTPSRDDDWKWEGRWKDGKPHSSWQDLPPLQAEPGVTALAGQVLNLKGEPLPNVTLETDGIYGSGKKIVPTDETGRFLLQNIQYGEISFVINGTSANTRGKTYGIFKVAATIKKGQTNVLPYTIWMPRIDTANAVTITSPTTSEVVVTTPKIRGLEVRIPAGAVIRDHKGDIVTQISVTQLPLDRTPFPLPKNVPVPVYFTIQPGGSYIYASQGARLIYPNFAKKPVPPGGRFDFWHYAPENRGWYIYGQGSVTQDGKQIVPDSGVSIYEFTGAMVGNGPAPPPPPEECQGADPVDFCTGLFLLNKTDLSLPDVIPLNLERTYLTRDTVSRAFGIGASHPYEIYLYSINNYVDLDLILANGRRIHYVRTSPGTGFTDAIYEHRPPDATCPTCVGSGTIFNGSKIAWNGHGWDLTLKDGTVYAFPESCPGCPSGGLNEIRDRYGNRLTIARATVNQFGDPFGKITKIMSPNDRWIEFTYDDGAQNCFILHTCITEIRDNTGRTVTYTYDTDGRLFRVTDPNGGVTEYTYDTSHRMLTVKNPRGINLVTNEYDANGWVKKQTLAAGTPDAATYQFTYLVNGTRSTQTDVTDQRGNIRRLQFDANGNVISDTRALGTPEEQTTAYEWQPGTEMILSQTDALGRKTAYEYDGLGNLTKITRLAHLPVAERVTTTFTYEPTFNQVATITDPLNHTTTLGYDAHGNLTSITQSPDGITQLVTNIDYNTAGQPISITDPLNNATQFTYDFGDLVAVTDPLGNITNHFVDAAGRLLNQTNPLGHLTLYDYNSLNRLTKVIDPLNGSTQFGYDPNGNLLSVADARNNVTAYTYNNMDRLATRRDPLLKTESYAYDLAGNLTQFTDRKTQATNYTYDALNRRVQATYADLSSTTYTYDKANRLTQVNDSNSGLITRTYDGLDRLISETTSQGSVSYTSDAASRRTSMTVSGQTAVNYAYDNMNRLIQITQGSSTVSFTYDNASRRQTLTLPNGVLVEYTYDSSSRVTEIQYKKVGTLLGNLTYSYDKAGSRTKTGGTFARTGIPAALSAVTFDAANRQINHTYDNNGNLLSDGTNTYTWNARNQLASITGASVSASFVYDGLGRREKKTINSNLTEFLYDGVNPVQETSGATVLANILTGLGIDEYFTHTDVGAGTTSSFLSDALGSALALADSAGTVQTEYIYEPFGRTTATGVSSTNAFQYAGRENDGTGLYYYRARYYHPGLQRFLSEDPIFHAGNLDVPYLEPFLIGKPLQLHSYMYALSSPLRFVDPSGLCPCDCLVKANEWFNKCNKAFGGLYYGCVATCNLLTKYLPGGTIARQWCIANCTMADNRADEFCKGGYGKMLTECSASCPG